MSSKEYPVYESSSFRMAGMPDYQGPGMAS
jgi:hypothetical protein